MARWTAEVEAGKWNIDIREATKEEMDAVLCALDPKYRELISHRQKKLEERA